MGYLTIIAQVATLFAYKSRRSVIIISIFGIGYCILQICRLIQSQNFGSAFNHQNDNSTQNLVFKFSFPIKI